MLVPSQAAGVRIGGGRGRGPADAAQGLIDVKRLGQLLARIRGRIRHARLDHLSPFSVSVILEIGRQRAPGDGAGELILAGAAEDLIAEAIA